MDLSQGMGLLRSWGVVMSLAAGGWMMDLMLGQGAGPSAAEAFQVFEVGGHQAIQVLLLQPGQGKEEADDGEGGEHGRDERRGTKGLTERN